MLKKSILAMLTVMTAVASPAMSAHFTDIGDGTVADGDTSLVWQQRGDNIAKTWEEAINYCETLSLAEAQDWRLPNIKELSTLVDYTVFSPAINQTFFPGGHYVNWSSTSDNRDPSVAWVVHFGDGEVSRTYYNKFSNPSYVLCVRGGFGDVVGKTLSVRKGARNNRK